MPPPLPSNYPIHSQMHRRRPLCMVMVKLALLVLVVLFPLPQGWGLRELKETPSSPDRWEIAPGVYMPVVNLGHPDDGGLEVTSALKWLAVGGRGIDTALVYQNQDQVGEAVRQSGVPRKHVFITTKIPCPYPPEPGSNRTAPRTAVTPEMALAGVRQDLAELQLDYVDLMLLHWPCRTDNVLEDTKAAWRGLQQAQELGLVRAVGVSNFKPEHLDAVVSLGGTRPAVNQCQMSVGSHDDVTIAHTTKLGIKYEAYSPLRHISLTDPSLERIAKAHGKSSAQVALKWINQQEVLIATSPGQNESFMLADLDLASFTLTTEEMDTLSKIQAGPTAA